MPVPLFFRLLNAKASSIIANIFQTLIQNVLNKCVLITIEFIRNRNHQKNPSTIRWVLTWWPGADRASRRGPESTEEAQRKGGDQLVAPSVRSNDSDPEAWPPSLGLRETVLRFPFRADALPAGPPHTQLVDVLQFSCFRVLVRYRLRQQAT